MGKVMLEGYKCERCEHTWIPRASTDETPTICPKCKSPYWNKARKIQGQSLGKQIAGEKLSKARKKWKESKSEKI
jgi:DNA-directed RNA polymerase subunit RPC12/RpoP